MATENNGVTNRLRTRSSAAPCSLSAGVMSVVREPLADLDEISSPFRSMAFSVRRYLGQAPKREHSPAAERLQVLSASVWIPILRDVSNDIAAVSAL